MLFFWKEPHRHFGGLFAQVLIDLSWKCLLLQTSQWMVFRLEPLSLSLCIKKYSRQRVVWVIRCSPDTGSRKEIWQIFFFFYYCTINCSNWIQFTLVALSQRQICQSESKYKAKLSTRVPSVAEQTSFFFFFFLVSLFRQLWRMNCVSRIKKKTKKTKHPHNCRYALRTLARWTRSPGALLHISDAPLHRCVWRSSMMF